MMLVDSNVLIDLIEGTSAWSEWSRHAVAKAQAIGPLVINHIIVAELASLIEDEEGLEAMIASFGLSIVAFDIAGALRSGKAFHDYRRRGGKRTAILADFLIAGHASALGASLMTRDKRKIASYFPELTLITPETEA